MFNNRIESGVGFKGFPTDRGLRVTDIGGKVVAPEGEASNRSEGAKSILGDLENNPFSNRQLMAHSEGGVNLRREIGKMRGEVSTEAYRAFSDVAGNLKQVRLGKGDPREHQEYLGFVLKGLEKTQVGEGAQPVVAKIMREVESVLDEVDARVKARSAAASAA